MTMKTLNHYIENVEKLSYVLGSELWESKFDGLLSLVKEYIADVWEKQKHKLNDRDPGYDLQFHFQSSPGERNGKFGQNSNLGQNCKVHKCYNVSSPVCNCGNVVDDSNVMAEI